MRISDWSSDVCSSDLRHHGVHAGADLLHDAEIAVELCGDALFRRQLARIGALRLDGLDPAGEEVVVALEGGAAGGDGGEPLAPRLRPAGLPAPLLDLRLGRGALVAHVDGRGRALERSEAHTSEL